MVHVRRRPNDRAGNSDSSALAHRRLTDGPLLRADRALAVRAAVAHAVARDGVTDEAVGARRVVTTRGYAYAVDARQAPAAGTSGRQGPGIRGAAWLVGRLGGDVARHHEVAH